MLFCIPTAVFEGHKHCCVYLPTLDIIGFIFREGCHFNHIMALMIYFFELLGFLDLISNLISFIIFGKILSYIFKCFFFFLEFSISPDSNLLIIHMILCFFFFNIHSFCFFNIHSFRFLLFTLGNFC